MNNQISLHVSNPLNQILFREVFHNTAMHQSAHPSCVADWLKQQQTADWKRWLCLLINQSRRLLRATHSPLFEEGTSRQSKQPDGACRHDCRWPFNRVAKSKRVGLVWPELKSIKGATLSLINSTLLDRRLLIRAKKRREWLESLARRSQEETNTSESPTQCGGSIALIYI